VLEIVFIFPTLNTDNFYYYMDNLYFVKKISVISGLNHYYFCLWF